MKDSLQDNRITPEDMQKTIHLVPAHTVHPNLLWVILVIIALAAAAFMGITWWQQNNQPSTHVPIEYTPEQKQDAVDTLNQRFESATPEQQDAVAVDYLNGYSQQDAVFLP